jgi:hypothetical protein
MPIFADQAYPAGIFCGSQIILCGVQIMDAVRSLLQASSFASTDRAFASERLPYHVYSLRTLLGIYLSIIRAIEPRGSIDRSKYSWLYGSGGQVRNQNHETDMSHFSHVIWVLPSTNRHRIDSLVLVKDELGHRVPALRSLHDYIHLTLTNCWCTTGNTPRGAFLHELPIQSRALCLSPVCRCPSSLRLLLSIRNEAFDIPSTWSNLRFNRQL